MQRSKLDKFILKTDYSRRYPDPLNKTTEGDPYNIEHHVLLCKAIDVPSGISKEPNPREQKIDVGIYKDIQESLEDSGDLTFHLKNKGITVLAHHVEYSEDKRVVTVYLDEDEGIVDGGHTYEIILNAQSQSKCPEDQYVRFEIITGVPRNMRIDITRGLNTAVQVQEASLANLDDRFDWIKETLEDMPYADQIAYKQNERKPVDIRDIIGYLTLFNIEHEAFKNGKHPKEAYVSKAKCLQLYLADQKSYEMLKPLLKDILYLHDYIHIRAREIYNADKGGRAGAMKGVFEHKDEKNRKNFPFLFINEERKDKLYDGALFPIFGAMRFLVQKKPGEDVYSWKLESFEKVKSFFDKIAANMIATTYNTSVNYGRKPNAIGKDDNHWDNLYKTVALAYLQRNNSKLF